MPDSTTTHVIGVPDEQTVNWLEKQFGFSIRPEKTEDGDAKKVPEPVPEKKRS